MNGAKGSPKAAERRIVETPKEKAIISIRNRRSWRTCKTFDVLGEVCTMVRLFA
jgi:hypothetical protein